MIILVSQPLPKGPPAPNPLNLQPLWFRPPAPVGHPGPFNGCAAVQTHEPVLAIWDVTRLSVGFWGARDQGLSV